MFEVKTGFLSKVQEKQKQHQKRTEVTILKLPRHNVVTDVFKAFEGEAMLRSYSHEAQSTLVAD